MLLILHQEHLEQSYLSINDNLKQMKKATTKSVNPDKPNVPPVKGIDAAKSKKGKGVPKKKG